MRISESEAESPGTRVWTARTKRTSQVVSRDEGTQTYMSLAPTAKVVSWQPQVEDMADVDPGDVAHTPEATGGGQGQAPVVRDLFHDQHAQEAEDVSVGFPTADDGYDKALGS